MSQIIPLFKRVDQSAPEKVSTKEEKQNEKFFIFRLSGDAFVIPAVDVAEVAAFSSLIDIPQKNDLVSGVVNVRGTVIPVINLRKRLGLAKDFEINNDTKIIYFKIKQNFFIGMIIDDLEYNLRDGVMGQEASVMKTPEGKAVKSAVIGDCNYPVFMIDEWITKAEFQQIEKVLESF